MREKVVRGSVMKKPGLVCVVTIAWLLAACAQQPIVDMKGVDREQYRQDLAECEQYAQQVSTGEEVAKHAVIGAAVGGAIGAVVGDSRTAERVAGAGAISGSTKGAARAEQRKDRVVFNCLKGRGYKVLG